MPNDLLFLYIMPMLFRNSWVPNKSKNESYITRINDYNPINFYFFTNLFLN